MIDNIGYFVGVNACGVSSGAGTIAFVIMPVIILEHPVTFW